MTELDRLEQYLHDRGYKYKRIDNPIPQSMIEVREKYNLPVGWCEQHQLIVYDVNGRRLWDAICQWGSYGYSQGLIEVMGTMCQNKHDRVEGWLTAQDIINRLEAR